MCPPLPWRRGRLIPTATPGQVSASFPSSGVPAAWVCWVSWSQILQVGPESACGSVFQLPGATSQAFLRQDGHRQADRASWTMLTCSGL